MAAAAVFETKLNRPEWTVQQGRPRRIEVSESGPDVSLKHDQDAHENRQGQTVPKDRTQNRSGIGAFGMPPGGDTRHHNALRIDHFAHHAA